MVISYLERKTKDHSKSQINKLTYTVFLLKFVFINCRDLECGDVRLQEASFIRVTKYNV